VNDQTDLQLLRAYAESRSETAFAELVRRHVDFVYSAARRMVCDPHLAEDVTQSVFVAFAKNAAQLSDRPVLSGWLHRAAQNIAAQTVRTIERRRAREQEAVAMNELLSNETDADWENIAPHLDAALGELSEPDRDALLLRYFEKKSAREMSAILNVSEEAAQKRVNRAVERLRELFSKRNVTLGASGLVVLISANAVQAAPVGLALSISAAVALIGTTLQTSTAIVATKTIAMTTLQKTLITTALAVATGAGIYQARQNSTLRKQLQAFREELPPQPEEIQKLKQERDELARQLVALREENERANQNTRELVKLRNEVATLREKAKRLAATESVNSSNRQAISFESDPTESGASETATANAVAKSFVSAMHHSNLDELRMSVATDSDPNPDAILQYFIAKNAGNHDFGPPVVFSEMDVIKTNSTEAEGFAVIMQKTTLRKVNGEWKVVLHSLRDSNGNISYVGFEKPKQ
jgi:RNA polymerase sigma factor (sigma-70 family)